MGRYLGISIGADGMFWIGERRGEEGGRLGYENGMKSWRLADVCPISAALL